MMSGKARVVIFLSSILAVFVSVSCQIVNPNCNYNTKLESGKTYYVYNPGYPNPYRGQQSCQWTATSDTRVQLTCNQFSIPRSNNCILESLTVQVSPTITRRHCGEGSFSAESEGNTMVIRLNAPFWSTGGTFLCELKATERTGGDGCRCGWKNPTRIVGGVETGINEYPMMAGIVDATIREVYCGATIISPRHVLTAAHCMTNRNYSQLAVLVGDHDLTTGAETNSTALHRVADVQVHPNYPLVGTDDIAVISLASVINFSNAVGPACLPFQHRLDSFAGNYVDLLGWGTVEFGGQKSDTLQKVTLSVLSNLQCAQSYPALRPQEVCTYGRGKDSCQFDSGGPVLWQNPTSMQLVHVAIIRGGSICASDAPGLNTRVGPYLDWILSVTPGVSYCMAE